MSRFTDERLAKTRCMNCGQYSIRRVKQPYAYDISHDGRPPVTISIPDLEVIACTNPECSGHASGESVTLDDVASLRITVETYKQLGLLTPDEIRAGRKKLGMKQSELQELLGLGGNTLSRWEKGRVYQSRTMDKLLRLAFSVPEAIEFLKDPQSRITRAEPQKVNKFKYLTRIVSLNAREQDQLRISYVETGQHFTPKEFFALN